MTHHRDCRGPGAAGRRSHVAGLVALVVAASGAAGCGSEPAPPASRPDAPANVPSAAPPARSEPPAPAPAAVPRVERDVRSNAGTYLVTYWFEPDPLPLNELFSIGVAVHDGADRTRAVRDVELVVDGRMPEHRHGMNREPTVERRDDGTFVVRGMLFHMPGLWELHFDLTKGGVTERAQADVELE